MKIYNTLTRQKEEFIPIDEGKVKMYVCGPTVYDLFHIGNARTFVIFDTVRKYLEYRGYEVTYVQNFTDIDDKMIKKSEEANLPIKDFGDKYIMEYYNDADRLNIKRATYNPRATEYIKEIIEFISDLENKGLTYEVDGDVYFETQKFSKYGKLSGQNLDDLKSGSRIEIDKRKKHPIDFVLWKSAKANEPSWKSPWGMGRPGWHIECSCMASNLLGETIDIHAGGTDLIFPHHENEIAQSEARSGKEFANYWMHGAFINVDNKKMSKSVGNFYTAREILDMYDVETIRLFMLSGHYRTQINFSLDLLDSSKASLERMYNTLDRLEDYRRDKNKKDGLSDEEIKVKEKLLEYKNRYIEEMDNDFNTADGISVIFEMIRFLNTSLNVSSSYEILSFSIDLLRELGYPIGILQKEKISALEEEIENLIIKRDKARENKDFKESDRIRDLLKERGIVLEDTAKGTRWKIIK